MLGVAPRNDWLTGRLEGPLQRQLDDTPAIYRDQLFRHTGETSATLNEPRGRTQEDEIVIRVPRQTEVDQKPSFSKIRATARIY